MAQSVPPGDIQTQPNAKIVFNAPYDDKHTYHIKALMKKCRKWKTLDENLVKNLQKCYKN